MSIIHRMNVWTTSYIEAYINTSLTAPSLRRIVIARLQRDVSVCSLIACYILSTFHNHLRGPTSSNEKVADHCRKALTTVSADACCPCFESLRNKMIRQVRVLEHCVPQPKTFETTSEACIYAHSAVTKPRLRRASRGTIYHVLDGRADHGPIK